LCLALGVLFWCAGNFIRAAGPPDVASKNAVLLVLPAAIAISALRAGISASSRPLSSSAAARLPRYMACVQAHMHCVGIFGGIANWRAA